MIENIRTKQTGSRRTARSTALITGASSGIGRELAQIFAKDGYNVVLVARDRARLEELAKELQAEHQVNATVIVQDLADPSAARSIMNELVRQEIAVDVLVNNAGTQVYGMFAGASLEQLLAMMQVNAAALVHLTHLLLPGMLEHGWGRILNVGSTGSFAPGPLNAVYCATKAFVLSFSQALGAELAGTGVTVTTLCPGATQTAFITRHGLEDVRIFHSAMSPVRVAKTGYRALQQGRPWVVAGLGNWLQVLSFQLMAPFLAFTPPAWLMAFAKVLMGRAKPGSQQVQTSDPI